MDMVNKLVVNKKNLSACDERMNEWTNEWMNWQLKKKKKKIFIRFQILFIYIVSSLFVLLPSTLWLYQCQSIKWVLKALSAPDL